MRKLFSILFASLIFTTVTLSYTAYRYKEKSKHRFDVHIPLNQALFEQKLSQKAPEWMLEQIQTDLSSHIKTGISGNSLDSFFQKEKERLQLIHFSIKNRHLSCSLSPALLDHKQFRHFLAALEKLNTLTPLPDVDFIISLEDGFTEDLPIPLFVFAKAKKAVSLLLMPDFKALTGYPTLRSEIEKANQKWPWESKVTKAFWRGSTTGGYLTALNWAEIPRVKLALSAIQHPEKIDAKLTGIVQCDPEIPSLIQSKGLTGKKASQKDHLKYKYLVDIDGNSCSYERYFWILLSNSLVLKQTTNNLQWYYGALKPYEHFIPIKEDLSDLTEQIAWAETHDDQAKQIASNSTRFIQEELSIESTFLYLTHLLREYARHTDSYVN